MKKAFTLAEVLITLGIIGVVAAMTIPTLVTGNKEKSMQTATSVFNRKLGEALKIMNAQSELLGYTTTKEFVNALAKHIKIVTICDNNELSKCFAGNFTLNNETIDTNDLSQAENLNGNVSYGTETIGVQFADGVSALIAYNPSATQDPFNSGVISFGASGSGKNSTVTFYSDAISMLYDITGPGTPNIFDTEKGDIKGLNIVLDTTQELEFLNLGYIYAPINCSDTSSEDYKYCLADSLARDNLAASMKACDLQGMRLPTEAELLALYARKGEDGIPTTGTFKSSTIPPSAKAYSMIVSFDDGSSTIGARDGSLSHTLCVTK